MTKNFPKFMDIKPQIQETLQTPRRKSTKKITPSFIIVKMPKNS